MHQVQNFSFKTRINDRAVVKFGYMLETLIPLIQESKKFKYLALLAQNIFVQ